MVCNQGHLDKVDQSDSRKINNTFQESSLWANQQLLNKNNKLLEAQNLNIDGQWFSRKQNVSPDSVLLFETLHYNIIGDELLLNFGANFQR